LDIPELSKAASAANIFSAIENNSLLSVGQLCDEVYSVLLIISEFTIMDSKQKTLLKGIRDSNTGLWRINVCKKKVQTKCGTATPQNQISAANNVYALRNTGALVDYLHKAMISFTRSALIHAVKKGHLATWRGLTEDAINKYLKLTPATTMGHMNQKRQNTRSTSKKVKHESEDEDITTQVSSEKTHLFFAVVLDQGQSCTDLMGTFPARSSKGNACVTLMTPTASGKLT
jgi:hypothetical protein